MLYVIGLGLGDEKDITVNGLEIAKNCECYLEMYTSKWSGSLKKLEEMIGDEIHILKRRDLEDKLPDFLQECKTKNVALFVLGDPLAATTHVDIVLQAKRHGIKVRIIHNSSIFSAVAETGLQLYKFGKTATVPFTLQTDAVQDALIANEKDGLHTLLLLDLDAEKEKYMSAGEALKLLLEKKLLLKNQKVVVASAVGTERSEIHFGEASKYINHKETPAIIVVPGKLHFMEEGFLESLR